MKLQTPSQQMKNRSHPPSCTQTKTEVWCAICTVLLPPQETVGGRSSRLEATDYWDRVGTLVKNWYNEKPTGWVEECVFVFMCRGFKWCGRRWTWTRILPSSIFFGPCTHLNLQKPPPKNCMHQNRRERARLPNAKPWHDKWCVLCCSCKSRKA